MFIISGVVCLAEQVTLEDANDEEKAVLANLKEDSILLRNTAIPSANERGLLMAVRKDALSAYEVGRDIPPLKIF